jgi:hypothetical protein
LAYDSSGDAVDEYLRMGASTATKCMKHFCSALIKAYQDEYLRQSRLSSTGNRFCWRVDVALEVSAVTEVK